MCYFTSQKIKTKNYPIKCAYFAKQLIVLANQSRSLKTIATKTTIERSSAGHGPLEKKSIDTSLVIF